MKNITNNFTKIFKEFTKEINKQYKLDIKVSHASDFTCLPEDSKIFVSMLTSESSNIMFMKEFENKLDVDIDINLLSYLHELGHIFTYDYEYEEQDQNKREYIRKCLDISFFTLEEATDLYYKLPLEQFANNWAIDFINNNVELINKWNKQYNKAIIKIKKRIIKTISKKC